MRGTSIRLIDIRNIGVKAISLINVQHKDPDFE